MCFFLFAPGKRISIRYAAESVTLEPRGGASSVIDLLVANADTQPVDEFHVLYPHAYEDIEAALKADPVGRARECFRLITETIASENSPFNTTPFHTESVGGALRATLVVPDPDNPARDVEIVGFIRGTQTATVYDGCPGAIAAKLLKNLGWCLVTIQLSEPLPPQKNNEAGDPRWLRLSTRYRPAGDKRTGFLEYWFRRMVNRLRYAYELRGCYDLAGEFRRRLDVAVGECKNGRIPIELLTATLALVALAQANQFETPEEQVEVQDWRIRVYPNVYDRVEDISTRGDVIPMPWEQLRIGRRWIMYKDWWAGQKRITSPKARWCFGISFWGPVESRWILLLPYAGLMALLISVGYLVAGLLGR